MIILSIETSCDETGISLIEATGGIKNPKFTILSDFTISQISIHQQYGGVFPNMAKREHQKNIIPIFKKVLEESQLLDLKIEKPIPADLLKKAKLALEREPELYRQFIEFIPNIQKPKIDMIAVTQGPGLEPTLWVGLNFAKALGLVWNIPIMPVNHMEGHIIAALTPKHQTTNFELSPIKFPALALLISGGHTELVEIKKWGQYNIVGKTRDDAVGECFDKVARMLHLPYPGGPQISALAELSRSTKTKNNNGLEVKLPRPMLNSEDLDFSFSGLKTSVLYFLQKQENVSDDLKQKISEEFEDAVCEVLAYKTTKAINEFNIESLIVGGGVSANKHLRKVFEKEFSKKVNLFFPSSYLSTDNALMIGMAGYLKTLYNKNALQNAEQEMVASGNMSLEN